MIAPLLAARVVMGVAYALATAGYLMLFEMFWKT